MVKNIFLILTLAFLLCSCYSQKVYLNKDKKSGYMEIEYAFDDDLFQILSIAFANFQTDYSSQFDPIVLIDEEMFKEQFKDTANVRLRSVAITKGDLYKGKIVMEFSDFEKAIAQLPVDTGKLKIERAGSIVSISQMINLTEVDPDGIFNEFIKQQKEDDIELYNKLTGKTNFTFEINTKSDIKKVEGFLISGNNKKATYNFKLTDLLKENAILKFSIDF